MNWHYATVDGRTKLSLREGNANTFGTLSHGGSEIFVIGNSPRGNPPTIEISNAPASGRIVASGDKKQPTSLRLTGSVPTIAGGTEQIDVELLPMADGSIEDIVDAYRRSFAVITIDGTHDNPRCTQAWQGGATLAVRDGTIGLKKPVGFDYDSDPANTQMPDEAKAQICRQDENGNFVIHVPKIASTTGEPGPVLIQFVGEAGHFSSPPFAETHEQVLGVYQEDYKRQCLTIEYANVGPPQTLHFNDGRKKGHRSIIIRPD